MKHAEKKFTRYINSCETGAHLMICDTLINVFKMRYPFALTAITRLQLALQLKRIEINHLNALTC